MSKQKADKRETPSSAAQVNELPGTSPLSGDLRDQIEQPVKEIKAYLPTPQVLADPDGNPLPHWRIRLDVDADPPEALGFDLYGPVTLGRGVEDELGFVDLTDYKAADQGVSRKHLEIRPSPHSLFAVDLGSTNGSYKNGVLIKANSPTPLGDRDTLSLGALHVTITIVDPPQQEAEFFRRQATLGQALTEIAKALTTQLKVEDVMTTVVDYAIGLTGAQQAILWLMDSALNDLRMEAAIGVESEFVKTARLPVQGTLVGDAMMSDQPTLHTRKVGGSPVAITDDYQLESALFVPLSLGGMPLGVLSVGNRTQGHDFTEHDQTLLVTLADFAAIALQNSRTLEATDAALRESLRAQREATAKALETTRLKTEFLSTVSHELRSPLHTINGFSKMALSGSLGSLTPELKDSFERISSGGKELLEMVDTLLDTQSIEAQRIELANEEFSPRELISEIVKDQKPAARDKGLLLAWSSDMDVPQTIMGDSQRIRQVMINLVTNAIKFTDNGSVSISLRMIGKLMWSISVTDTGIGIKREDQAVIFEKFRQADQSKTRKHGGVGLGLAIASELVELMGGALRVSSTGIAEQGSTFTITLPLALPGEEMPIFDKDDTIKLGRRKAAAALNKEDTNPGKGKS